jgi:hypothetical protein
VLEWKLFAQEKDINGKFGMVFRGRFVLLYLVDEINIEMQ